MTRQPDNHARPILTDATEYPKRLLAVKDAPEKLYALGECDLNSRHIVAIVGTRSATAYALGFINALIDDLNSHLDSLVIASGLALGCDVMAHRRAIEAGVPTVALLAHGLDRIYPAAHRQLATRMVNERTGMLLTTYPEGTPIHRGNFLARNKVIAGICDCVVVAESAADRGGALHTARYAAAIGKKVFALPGRITDRYSRGCNMLVREGTAHLVESAEDIIRAMGWTPRHNPEGVQQELFPSVPTGDAATIASFLEKTPDATADTISAGTGIPIRSLLSTLMEMEFNDLVISLPGNRYRLQ